MVFADADLDRAVPGAGMGVFSNSGQVCCAGTRIFVERPIYDEFVERVSAFANGLRVGDSLDPQTQIGPLVSAQQLDRVTGYLDMGRAEGARADGRRPPGRRTGDLAERLLRRAHRLRRRARRHAGGPGGDLRPGRLRAAVRLVDEVAVRANDTPSAWPAASGPATSARRTAWRRRLQAGTVWVNTMLLIDPAVPFGGYKMSGWGREMGEHGLDEYLNVKSVWIDTE